MMSIFTYVVEYFSSGLGMLELVGSLASLICVYLATKHNIWTWFWGAIGAICFGVLFCEFRLFSDMVLQLAYFLPMQYYGWKLWQQRATIEETHVEVLAWSKFGLTCLLIIALSAMTGYLMLNVFEANKSYPDALLAWMSVFGQLYLNRQYLQSWILWICVDIVGIWVYFTSGLYVTAGLYGIFLVLASLGFIKWWNIYYKG